MKIQLLISICDSDYAEHLSRVLIEKKSEVFEISVCSTPENLKQTLLQRRFDVVLMDNDMVEAADISQIALPIFMWDGTNEPSEKAGNMFRIHQYQRISTISGEIVQQYAVSCGPKERLRNKRAKITAVWSPMGGVGKTTVALAYAVQKSVTGAQAAYLSLEPFSAAEVWFKEPGKSISNVFEKLNGDAALILQSIQTEDSGTGVIYFGAPRNYDDINILTEDDIHALLEGGAVNYDELIVDLGSNSSKTVCEVLKLADQIFWVVDSSAVCRAKCDQFRTQHSLYAELKEKLTVVANRGARGVAAGTEALISLPKVETDHPVIVYKTLSQYLM